MRPAALVPVLLLALAPACSETSAPATAASIAFAGGSASGTVAHALAEDPVVMVRSADGNTIVGARVTFKVIAGDGFVADSVVETDGTGRAEARWTLGTRANVVQRLRASVAGVTADFEATAAPAVPGQTYFGRNRYIEYVAGDLPIVITAPHGGSLRPSEIRDRTTGITEGDANTQELARAIASAFVTRTGRRPHLVLCRIHRIKLDANREIVEAAQGSAPAQLAWREFHAYTDAAKQAIIDAAGRGFYVDLHGHSHAIPRLELGYTLNALDLALSDAQIAQPAIIDRSTIRTLARTSSTGFAELLRGATSLGALFQAEGYATVPSPVIPSPGGAAYFMGGYNVSRHGSRDGGPVDGVQIEAQFPGVRDTDANRARFAEAIAAVLDGFLDMHYPEYSRAFVARHGVREDAPAAGTLPGRRTRHIVAPPRHPETVR